jgi:hypothetical protein
MVTFSHLSQTDVVLREILRTAKPQRARWRKVFEIPFTRITLKWLNT